MAVEFFAQGSGQRDDDQRDDDYRENRVRGQQREVYGTNPALTAEADDSGVQVEVNVAREKNRGTAKRGEHANFVREHFAAPDERIARHEKYSGGSV
jgi:hypothetical protein